MDEMNLLGIMEDEHINFIEIIEKLNHSLQSFGSFDHLLLNDIDKQECAICMDLKEKEYIFDVEHLCTSKICKEVNICFSFFLKG